MLLSLCASACPWSWVHVGRMGPEVRASRAFAGRKQMTRPTWCIILAHMGKQPVPGAEDAFAFGREAFFNAGDLLDDAEVLLSAGRWARAYALTTLALEEFGKGVRCFTVYAFRVAGWSDAEVREFWPPQTNHSEKLLAALGWMEMFAVDVPLPPVSEMLSTLASRVSDHNARKQNGFYVDLAADGSLISPKQIGEAEARGLVEESRAGMAQVLAVFTDSRFVQVMSTLGPRVDQVLRDSVATAQGLLEEPGKLMVEAHRAVHGEGGPTATPPGQPPM